MSATSPHVDPYLIPTLDELLAEPGWLSVAQQPRFAAAAEIRFDGVRYGAIRPQRATQSRYDARYDQNSLEQSIAAHAFAAAGITDVELLRDHRPDYRCSIAGETAFGLEVAELHHPAHAEFQNNTAAITIGVRDALDKPHRIALSHGVHCCIALSLAPRRAAYGIRDEIIAWIDSELADAPAGRVIFDPERYPLLTQHKPLGTIVRGEGRSFMVKLPARSFSPEEIVPVFLHVLAKKRRKRYPILTPWLVTGVTEMWGVYGASLALLWQARDQIELAPFRRVFVQYGNSILILGDDERYVVGALQ